MRYKTVDMFNDIQGNLLDLQNIMGGLVTQNDGQPLLKLGQLPFCVHFRNSTGISFTYCRQYLSN